MKGDYGMRNDTHITVIEFTKDWGNGFSLDMVALFDDRDMSQEEALRIINSGEEIAPNIVVMQKRSYTKVFRSLFKEQNEHYKSGPLKKGDHAWAIVKESGGHFDLVVIPAVITEVAAEWVRFIPESDAKKPRGFAITTYTLPIQALSETVFRREEDAKTALEAMKHRC